MLFTKALSYHDFTPRLCLTSYVALSVATKQQRDWTKRKRADAPGSYSMSSQELLGSRAGDNTKLILHFQACLPGILMQIQERPMLLQRRYNFPSPGELILILINTPSSHIHRDSGKKTSPPLSNWQHTTLQLFIASHPSGQSCPHPPFLLDKLIRWKVPLRPRAREHYHLQARQKYWHVGNDSKPINYLFFPGTSLRESLTNWKGR